MRRAPVVIMDEPTASIDARAEAEIFERLREGVSRVLTSEPLFSIPKTGPAEEGAPDAREMPPNPATAPEPPAKASEILPAREVAPPPLEIHAESAREEKAVGEVLAKASEGDART